MKAFAVSTRAHVIACIIASEHTIFLSFCLHNFVFDFWQNAILFILYQIKSMVHLLPY